MTHWNNQLPNPNRYTLLIGIDTGVKTGFAVWQTRNETFSEVSTLQIDEAMEKILVHHKAGYSMKVRIEDARLRTWFGKNSNAKQQGAGSVKRDAKLWEDFLKRKNIPFEMVHPKNNKTKLDKKQFVMITKYTGLTSEHSRDAAMLVFKGNAIK